MPGDSQTINAPLPDPLELGGALLVMPFTGDRPVLSLSVRRPLAPPGATSATLLMTTQDLVAWATRDQQSWQRAATWLQRDLPEQIAAYWNSPDQSAQLSEICKRIADPGMALDQALCTLDPTYSAGAIALAVVPVIDLGLTTVTDQPVPFTLTNVGRRWAQIRIQPPPWLKVMQRDRPLSSISLAPREAVTLQLFVRETGQPDGQHLILTSDGAILESITLDFGIPLPDKSGSVLHQEPYKLISWCTASQTNWNLAITWLEDGVQIGASHRTLADAIEGVWKNAQLATALRTIVPGLERGDALHAALTLLAPEGYGHAVASLTVTQGPVDFGDLARRDHTKQVRVTNTGVRLTRVKVTTPSWVSVSPNVISLAPQAAVNLTVIVNLPAARAQPVGLMIGAIELREDNRTVREIPVRAQRQSILYRVGPVMKFVVALCLLAAAVFVGYTWDKRYTETQVTRYQEAVRVFDEGREIDARALFVALGNYQDSAERVREIDYRVASRLFEQGKFVEARAAFLALQRYKDAPARWRETFTRPLQIAVAQQDWSQAAIAWFLATSALPDDTTLPALLRAHQPLADGVAALLWQGTHVQPAGQVSGLRAASQLVDINGSLSAISLEQGLPLIGSPTLHTVLVTKTLSLGSTRDRTLARGTEQAISSPDGSTYALANTNYQVSLLAADATEPQVLSDSHTATVNALAFSPDSTQISSVGADRTLRTWRVRDRQMLYMRQHTRALTALAVSNQNVIITGDDVGNVQLWRADTNDAVQFDVGQPQIGKVRALAVSPAGTLIAAAYTDGTVVLWDAAKQRRQISVNPNIGPTTAVQFSPDGQTLVTGSSDGVVRLWRVSDGKRCQELSGHSEPIVALAFTEDGRSLVSADAKSVHWWFTPAVALIDPALGAAISQPKAGIPEVRERDFYAPFRVAIARQDWTKAAQITLALSAEDPTDVELLKQAGGSPPVLQALEALRWQSGQVELLHTLEKLEGSSSLSFAPNGPTLYLVTYDPGIIVIRQPTLVGRTVPIQPEQVLPTVSRWSAQQSHNSVRLSCAAMGFTGPAPKQLATCVSGGRIAARFSTRSQHIIALSARSPSVQMERISRQAAVMIEPLRFGVFQMVASSASSSRRVRISEP